MDYNSLYTTHDCHKWHHLFPEDKHYVNYQPNIIYALNKVDDVYYAFCNARYNGYMTENEDYGDMIATQDQLHLNSVHSNFLMNALNFYYFAIDLSWQVIYYYSFDSSYYFLCDQNEYDKYGKSCNYDNVLRALEYRNDYAILDILKDFSNNDLVLELRNLYNYMKHRGTIHFEGLGQQYSQPMFQVKVGNENITFGLFTKREQKIDELKSKLIALDKLFYDYFDNILGIIVPEDYVQCQFNLEKYMNVSMKIKEFQNNQFNDYKDKLAEFYREIIELR